MACRRILLVLLIALALAACAHAQTTAWERTYQLQYQGETALVCRDHFGVPHLYATGEAALFYANGYVSAEDRLFQLEQYRRDAKGMLAAIYGAGYLSHDQQVRREGYTEAELQAQFDALPAQHQAILTSYRDGINARLQDVLADPDNLGPKELWDLGLVPAAWTVTDSIAIMHMMVRRFGAGGGNELNNQAYLDANGWTAFNAWFPLNDPSAPCTIPAAESPVRPAAVRKAAFGPPINTFPGIPPEVLEQQRQEREEMERSLVSLGLPTKWGSFSDVVAPGKSATGHPLLLGAPQMGYTEPQIANEAALHAPGLDVAGMQFAGVPWILIGRNRYLAWTTTSGCSDNIDTMVETLNPANRYQYWYQGAWRDMERRTEHILVAGGSPVDYEVCRTVHGPVTGWDLAHNRAFAAQATFWGAEMSTIEAFLDYNLAHNMAEFQEGVTKVASSHNFLCADSAGNIGYWHAGRFPLRAAGVDPRLPTSGDGSQEWTGLRPFASLPQLLNPAQGYFTNWNNKPVWWWDHGDEREWIGYDHVQLIMDLMNPDPAVTFAEVEGVPHGINSKGTYMQVVEVGSDLALPAVNIVPPGQSGFISKTGVYDQHFFDQKDLYNGWSYKPFPFLVPELVATTFAPDPLGPVQGTDDTDPLPFTLRLECRSPLGELAAGYQGTAALSVPAGLTVTPAAVTLTDGVWSGEVRVSGPPQESASIGIWDSYWQASGTSTSFRLAGKADVNADGAVNVLDVVRAVNLALGRAASEPPASSFQAWAADPNRDHAVNILDVVGVVNRSLGLGGVGLAPAAGGLRTVSLRHRGKDTWLVQVSDAAGLAGFQLDLDLGNGLDPVSVALAPGLLAAGWELASAPVGDCLRVVAYHPAAQPLAGGEGALLRVECARTGEKGRRGPLSLSGVTLSDAAGERLAAAVRK